MEQIKVELQDFMGTDRSVAEAAWTSSTTLESKELRTDADVERVVKMLIENKHASPIEAVVMRFWIKMPIQTDRQHMTHRIASHNGMSGRYRTMPSEFMNTPADIKDILGKYNLMDIDAEYLKLATEANSWYKDTLSVLRSMKMDNVEYKRLREFYRGILPQNNMTERVTVMNLRSFANYQKLRNSEHAQPEIRHVAKLMLDEVVKNRVSPVTIQTLMDKNWEI